MKNENVNKAFEIFYKYLPHGIDFSDATHEIFQTNRVEGIEVKQFLLEHEILKEWGEAGKLILSSKGKGIWIKYGCIEKYIEEINALKKKEDRLNALKNEKLIYDSRISKWQAKTFWLIFFFGLIGGICGIISLAIQIIKM